MLAFVDKDADEERRLDGALLLARFMTDLMAIRMFFVKLDSDEQ